MLKNKLKSKTGKALKWNTGYTLIENVISLGIGIILARLLDPNQFGILAVALALSSFVNSFVDGGFGSAIVQSKQLKESDLSTIYTLNLIVAIFFSVTLFSLSGLIGDFFQNKNIGEVSKALTLIFLFQAFIVVPKNFLVRNVDFKSIAIIELTALFISGVSSVMLAVYGFEYWALALRIIIRFLIAAILYNLTSNLKLKLELKLTIIKKYWNYSISVLSTSIFVNIKTKFDVFIVGKLLSAENLGLYSRGKQYATLPQTFLYMVFNKPLFSTFSKIDKVNFLEHYDKWYRILSFVTLFTFFSVFLVSDEFIYLLLGEKWKGSIVFLKIFSFWGIFKALILFNFDIFNTKGKPRFNLINSLFEFFIFIVIVVIFYVAADANNLGIYVSLSAVLSTFFAFIFQNYQLTKVLKENFVKNITKNIKDVLITSFSFITVLTLSRFFIIDSQLIVITVKFFLFTTICLLFSFLLKTELFQLIFKK